MVTLVGLLRAALGQTREFTLVLDTHGHVAAASAAASERLQWTSAELVERTVGDLFGDGLDGLLTRARRHERAEGSVLIRAKDGSRSALELQVVPLGGGDQTMGYLLRESGAAGARQAFRPDERERGLRLLLRRLADDVWWVDAAGTEIEVLETSDAHDRGSGGAVASSLALLHPDDLPGVLAAMQAARAEGDTFSARARGRRADGTYRQLELRAVALRRDDGSVYRWVGATLDVHDAQVAQERDAATRDRLRLALNAARMGIWELDLRSNMILWSPECASIFGVTEFDGTLESFHRLMHPDDLARHLPRFQEAIATGRDFAGEFRARKPSGEEIWVANLARPVCDAHGKPVRVVGTAQDVTERRRREWAAHDTEQRLRLAVESAPMSAWSLDPETDTVEVSARSTEWVAGLVTRTFTFAQAQAVVHPDDRAANAAAFRRTFEHGAPFDLTCRLFGRDGQTRWTVSRGSLVHGPDGRRRLFGVTLDVTDQVRTTTALRQAEERFAKVVQALPVGVCITERGTATCVDANPAFLDLLARSRDEVIGQSILSQGLWGDSALRALILGNSEAAVLDSECVLRTPEGDERYVLHSAELIDVSGRDCVLSMLHDISTHKRSAEALLQAQKMEAVGRLAGGVAHDFNNLLSALSATCFLLPHELESGKDLQPTLDVLQAVLERGIGLTRQLLALSRRQVTVPEVVDCNDHVRHSVGLWQHLLGADLALAVELAPDLPPIRIDPSQLEQVLLNLATNSRDAMPAGGGITIRTEAAEIDLNDPRVRAGLAPGRYVLLSVSDTGVGMSADTRARAFEPFFTTKPFGKGTGLGLAVVQGIVEQAGGRVEIRSEVGAGTTVSILLPATATQPTRTATTERQEMARGDEAVLVVEDDPEVRSLVRASLAALGYTVVEARDGPSALALLAQRGHAVRLVLTDVIMPGMNGRQLVEALRVRQPDLRVIYTSGYTADHLVRRGVLDGGEAYLQKPFSVADLSASVRRALDGAAGSDGGSRVPPSRRTDHEHTAEVE